MDGIVAHALEGNAEQFILRVARDMAADWVLVARALDGSDAVLSLVDRFGRQHVDLADDPAGPNRTPTRSRP